MSYKPYSPEWHRKRYLKEAIDTYFDDYVDNKVIYEDIMDILGARMSAAVNDCLLYTSPSPRDATLSRMPSSA